MPPPLLATKLHIPHPRPEMIRRPRLIERLNDGLDRKLTLVSAPAGFGKTTLVAEWIAACSRPAAWLSLDEGDSDPARFLTYFVAAVQTISPQLGEGVMAALHAPQPPAMESLLTVLLNEITALPHDFMLVLDDYHAVDAQPVDRAISFLLERLPLPMHLVIATREDPALPLARLRARGQLAELRAAELRFTQAEAGAFLAQTMGLQLPDRVLAALDARTEGWIAGLQLAAISMQGRPDAAQFVASFTGSNRFVLDYLMEEVLHQQPAHVQDFLLRTSILDRLCGPLCDAVVEDAGATGQETLEFMERANLFVVPLDDERRWYRYHHLFADLLRQQLQQRTGPTVIAEYHMRASRWYEANGLEFEAFHHAVAANHVDAAARLAEGNGMPLHFRGAAAPVLNWLKSLPAAELDARPVLWVIFASAMLFVSEIRGIEEKLQAAESALENAAPDERNRDLVGHIASIRATLAVTQHQVDAIVFQSQRALEFLHPRNLPVRTATTWTLGYAYQLKGDRAAAAHAYMEAIAISETIGHFIIRLMATLGLGAVQEGNNQLTLAAQTFRRALELAGEPPLPVACAAHLGLARIAYVRNNLEVAQWHVEQSSLLARQIETTDRYAATMVLLARLKLAQGDTSGAAAALAEARHNVQQHQFVLQMPEVAAAEVLLCLRQGNLAAATQLVRQHDLPLCQARVTLAQGDAVAAAALLGVLRQQVEARGWQDERLKVIVLHAVAQQACDEDARAAQLLSDALAMAAPEGMVRLFVDEGAPMARLLARVAAQGMMSDFVETLLAAFEAKTPLVDSRPERAPSSPGQPLVEPLSERELEILQLIAQGRSNREIGAQLFLALDTVKGHNRRIFEKLQVERRTEAVAKAHALNLLPRKR